MKIKYPVRPSPITPSVLPQVTRPVRFPLPLVSVNADEVPMLHPCLDIGEPTLAIVILRSSVSFAARSYFRPSDIRAVVFNVRSNVDSIYSLVV